jgi:iron complex transport system ATP-binding protein
MELTPIITAKDVSFKYIKERVLNNINFRIRRGEIVTILGPNGCGKSTLIKIIIGLLRPEKGNITFNGSNINDMSPSAIAREIAYVPQTHRSAFPYSVIDIVLMGRIPHKKFFFKYSRDDMEIAIDALERMSIHHLADKSYTELSGGERQLAIIARSLAQGARTFIMDEPASGLDYGNQLRLLEEITKLADEGYTFIKSTHSPEHALWIGDRVMMIRDGVILADGRAKDVVTSENIQMLYRIKVNIEALNGSVNVCVPQRLCKCKEMSRTKDQMSYGIH